MSSSTKPKSKSRSASRPRGSRKSKSGGARPKPASTAVLPKAAEAKLDRLQELGEEADRKGVPLVVNAELLFLMASLGDIVDEASLAKPKSNPKLKTSKKKTKINSKSKRMKSSKTKVRSK